jgi:hypothetical protein
MKGDKKYLKARYEAIQAAYEKLNKKDEKDRPIYSYTKMLSELSKQFHYSEKRIQEILLMDVEEWYEKETKEKSKGNKKQTELF